MNLNIISEEGALIQLTINTIEDAKEEGMPRPETALLTVRGGKDHNLGPRALRLLAMTCARYADLIEGKTTDETEPESMPFEDD
jgi:hypothetical protein